VRHLTDAADAQNSRIETVNEPVAGFSAASVIDVTGVKVKLPLPAAPVAGRLAQAPVQAASVSLTWLALGWLNPLPVKFATEPLPEM